MPFLNVNPGTGCRSSVTELKTSAESSRTSKDLHLPLTSLQKKLHQEVKFIFTLGSGNKKENLELTSGWSGCAVEYARMQVAYKKTATGFQSQFFAMKESKEEKFPCSSYAIFGSNGQMARGGNCQEHVGLAMYLFMTYCPDPSLKLTILEMDDCFDHVLLKVSLNSDIFYYDPWLGEFSSKQNLASNIKKTAKTIITGLKYEKTNATDTEEAKEIDKMIKQCGEKLKKPIKVYSIGTISAEHFKSYREAFESNIARSLKELYPSYRHQTAS